MSISKQQKAGYLAGLLLAPIFVVFAALGQPERGLLAMCVCGVFVTAAYVKRELLHKRYVWTTLLVLFVPQLAVIMLVHIPRTHLPGLVVMPFAFIDVALVFAIVAGVGKLVGDPRDT